jgi:ferritin-like protein
MPNGGYHESQDVLSEQTRSAHRAIVSLMEELEAIDWYQQRADACSDPELKDVLLHNKNEEVEHAAMLLEWIRRHDLQFDAMLRTYLFTEQPITAIESGSGAKAPGVAPAESLGVGGMKGR